MRSQRLLTFAFCALVVAPLLSQNQMRPGQWETTTVMDMSGMPVKMPPMKATRCVTPEQAKSPGDLFGDPGGRGRGGSNCKSSDYKVDGNKVTWKMACTGQDAMTGSGEMVFNGDSYTGTIAMSMAQGQMTMQLTGKRIGDCPP